MKVISRFLLLWFLLVTACRQPADLALEPSCVVAQIDALRVARGDVIEVRMSIFPPPGWDESVRLATAAALASTMNDGQVKEDSDAIGVSGNPWLAAYERLVRTVTLEGGGSPADIARRLDARLSARWRELGGTPGPCGKPLRTTGWISTVTSGPNPG